MHMIGLQAMQQGIRIRVCVYIYIHTYILWFQCGSMWWCVSFVSPFNKHSTITFSCKASENSKTEGYCDAVLTDFDPASAAPWYQQLVGAGRIMWTSEHMSRHVDTHVTISCTLFFFALYRRTSVACITCLFNVLSQWYIVHGIISVYIHTCAGLSIYGLVAAQFGKHKKGRSLFDSKFAKPFRCLTVLSSVPLFAEISRTEVGTGCCLWYFMVGPKSVRPSL